MFPIIRSVVEFSYHHQGIMWALFTLFSLVGVSQAFLMQIRNSRSLQKIVGYQGWEKVETVIGRISWSWSDEIGRCALIVAFATLVIIACTMGHHNCGAI